MDPYLTACTGMDALVHAIEAYVSTANSPILDLHALNAINLIFNNLASVLQKPDDIELRGRITLASLEAGLAFSNASLGAVHAMAHSLGGWLDLPHGECIAILLDHVVAFNFKEAPGRYRNVAAAMNIDHNRIADKDLLQKILKSIRGLKKDIGIEASLGMRGARKTDIPELAGKAMKDPCMVTNPRVPTLRDIEVIYEEAL
jgi:alcohol dehydrogenase class IV